jgi:Domain of unknown function (DUF4355)
MTETAGTEAGTAADPQTQPAAATPAVPAPPASPTPGVADRGAEEMLTDALDGDGGDGGDDAAAQLAKAQAEAKKWKDFARKHEAKVKELSPAARKLAEIEDANKSEVQRATDRAAEAERRAAEAEGRYHRTLAAAQYGLPPELIDLVGGTSEDEITASAEQIASVINTRVEEQVATRLAAITAANGNGTPQQAPARPQHPVESLRPGALPAAQAAASDGSAWIRQALDARR